MGVFIQQVINGLSIGSIYALMAVGYSLVYSILNFSNFAHGGVIMLGAYFGLYKFTGPAVFRRFDRSGADGRACGGNFGEDRLYPSAEEKCSAALLYHFSHGCVYIP